MTIRAQVVVAIFLGFGLLSGFAGLASGQSLDFVPEFFKVNQATGTQETYVLTVINRTDQPEEYELGLSDWLREPNGDHDWDVPLDGARWTVARSLAAGETIRVRYTVALPEGRNVRVTGWSLMGDDPLPVAISGPETLGLGGTSSDTPAAGGGVLVTRTVENVDPTGVVTVALEARVTTALAGLRLYEDFSEHVEIMSLDSAGGTFDAVARSCADWITLSDAHLRLRPGESREVSIHVAVPVGASGTYWSAVMLCVLPPPLAAGDTGMQIQNKLCAGVKVYVTVPGTEELAGRVSSVDVVSTDPLAIMVGFDCTGNVQVGVSGVVEVIDQTGTVVRSLPIGQFFVEPGRRRDVQVVDSSVSPLGSGVYQAVVRLDFGGENPVGGVRGFRVK